ncbi:hypothetical protein [Sorangium sp. So ce1099]|uniref:hypothetical protein n=1 Tax=Sorangium sp. So ce1099 TaxID=3133331 RepID=UPI003F611425
MQRTSILCALAGLAIGACTVDTGTSGSGDDGPLGEAAQSLVTDCDYLNPALWPPLPLPVDFDRELLIRDVAVVDDVCRTTWSGSCPSGGTPAAWTFGMLMRQMAGTTPAHEFVAEWLHAWEVPNVVNGFTVPARPGIRPTLIDPWLIASGCAPGASIVGPGACPLDITQAPFRLLAILNRADLEDPFPLHGGPPSPGEVRFVFGIVDLPSGSPLPATVILEYRLPSQRGGAAATTFDWASAFHKLSDPSLGPIGSPPYLAYLESLLTDITSPWAEPGALNNESAIAQVRTNEIIFGPDWKLRESTLQQVGLGPNAALLVPDTTKQTPDDTLNASGALDGYLDANALWTGSPNLINFTQTSVPAPLLGGESTSPPPPPGPGPFWDHTPATPLQPIERHHFALATCNGCHSPTELATPFTHIDPRPPGAPAGLSPFLSSPPIPAGGPVGLPAPGTELTVPDPAGTGAMFSYHEPWRRVCETTRILNGVTAPFTRANGAH